MRLPSSKKSDERIAECKACARPGKWICDLHARLPADYDEAADFGITFHSAEDGDWSLVRIEAMPPRCPICHPDDPRGPTGELLAWAKRVGEQRAEREVMEAVRAVAPEIVGRIHLALIKARAAHGHGN